MALRNTWVGYITRSYEQIKSDILTKFQSQIPEMTDHSESNIFVRMLGIWAGITEMLNYYIDNAARESYIGTARLFKSGVKLAKLLDYRIRGISPASVDLKFRLSATASSTVTIPVGTEVRTEAGLQYFTTASGIILAGSIEVSVPAKQKLSIANEVLGVSNGRPSQVFILGDDVVDKDISIVIGVDTYLSKDTLTFSTATSKDFYSSVNETGEVYIEFGDGISGMIPPAGQNIGASYFISNAEVGNVAENTINILSSVVTLPSGFTLTVTNINRASGGAGVEDLNSLRKRLPLSLKTLNRAVTDKDFEDLSLLVPGVAKAKTNFTCGKDVPIYIVPEGGGVASSGLLNDVVNYLFDKKVVGRFPRAIAAGEVRVILEADVTMLPNYSNLQGYTDIMTRLLNFLSVENQEISGTVHEGDIYQIIENTTGVKVSQLKKLSALPFASLLYTTTTALNWDRELQPTSTLTIKWQVKIISSTKFNLYKNNIFLGVYTIGDQVIQPEIIFTVNTASYIVGDSWEFTTYKYSGTLVLNELSIPISFIENIQLNVTGGI